QRVDEIRLAFPEPDVLDIGARRTGRGREMRGEECELVALIPGEQHLRTLELELEAVRRRGGVPPWDVTLGNAVAEENQPTCFVGSFCLRVSSECRPCSGRHYHQTLRSIACSMSSASQKPADRYFQPASAKTPTTTPSASSAASLRATWPTAPAETPAKIPSSSSSRRTSRTDSSFEKTTLRSSFDTSRIGGT